MGASLVNGFFAARCIVVPRTRGHFVLLIYNKEQHIVLGIDPMSGTSNLRRLH